MVKNLTKLEIEKLKSSLKSAPRDAPQSDRTLEAADKSHAAAANPSVPTAANKRIKSMDGIIAVSLLVLILVSCGNTFALLSKNMAALTDFSLKATKPVGNCTSVRLLDVAFDDNDDEDDEVWVTICAPACPIDSSNWSLSNQTEGDSWTKDALIIKCVTNMPKHFTGPKHGDLMVLTDGTGTTIDTIRYPDSGNNHHTPGHHDGRHADRD